MGRKIIGLVVGLLLVLAVPGSLAQNLDVEVSPVNTAADLDLSGDIVYAINFGNNGNPILGGVTFSQDQDHSNLSKDISAEGVISTWGGVYPNTGDPELDKLLGGIIWKNSTSSGRTTSVWISSALTVGTTYRLQLIFYTDHTRPMDIIVEGETIVEAYDPFISQGYVTGKGGAVVKCVFVARDTMLNIYAKSNPDVDASLLCGLILTQDAGTSFADYGSGTTTELVSGRGTWQINWGQGPWTWSNNEGDTLFGSNVSSVLALQTTAPAAVSADMVATLPVAGTLTLSARDTSNANVVIGTMTLSGTGVNIVDLNAARVVVDQGSGIGMAPFHAPGPELAMTLEEATGVFAHIRQTGDWRLELAGLYAMPLAGEGITQAHILAALGGKVPLIGGLGTFALSGQYQPVKSMKPQSFCEYGMGVATQFGAAGGVWMQSWGGNAWTWHTCPATVNAKFLGKSISGRLETTTTGAPSIDQDMVLRSPFGGRITLTKHSDTAPDEVTGQIVGEATGTFVGDVNAANATFNADGNIVCAFGVAVHNAPDALITVTEATGVYADIHPAGQWAWYVNGTMTIARVPDLPVQQNILAALQQPELLLGAHEEFVLTGWYYRQAP